MAPGIWERSGSSTFDLLIGAPTVGLVTFDWAINTIGLSKPLSTTIRGWKGMPFDVARNALVKDAQEVGAKYLLFLDTDVLPPPEAIDYLLYWKLPILSALVWSKRGSLGLWRLNPDSQTYSPLPQIPSDALVEVDAIPMGCCLVDMRVFDVIPEPWFTWGIKDPRRSIGGEFSEDFEFCRKAQEFGFKIFAYTGVKCNHETILPVDPLGRAPKVSSLD